MRTSGQMTLRSATDHQDRIEKEQREERKRHRGRTQEEEEEDRQRERKTFFSSFRLQSRVIENGNGECRSECNLPSQAAVRRPGAGAVACPGELLTLQQLIGSPAQKRPYERSNGASRGRADGSNKGAQEGGGHGGSWF